VSIPLINTSPSVALEVTSDRRLRADVIPSPLPTNGLQQHSAGLFARKGTRTNAFRVGKLSTQTIGTALNADSVVVWDSKLFDPTGILDLIAQPTRFTAPASGRYFVSTGLYVQIQGGGTFVNADAMIWFRKNGATFVGGRSVLVGASAGTNSAPGSARTYVDLLAGDYLEVLHRWYYFNTLTAGSIAQIGGGAVLGSFLSGWRIS